MSFVQPLTVFAAIELSLMSLSDVAELSGFPKAIYIRGIRFEHLRVCEVRAME